MTKPLHLPHLPHGHKSPNGKDDSNDKRREETDSHKESRRGNRDKGKGKSKQRPGAPQRSDTIHSRYVEMLLGQDDIPKFHNILASFFVWLLLAGFLVFPGTFTSLQKKFDKAGDEDEDWDEDAASVILHGVKNIPLVVVGAVACGISAGGMIFLAIRHVRNYVWLLNRLFLPGATNSVAGLISTLVGVYTQQDGVWSIMAKVTAIVEGSCLVACGGLFLIFERYLLRKVRRSHGSHYDNDEEAHAGEGFKEKIERKAKEPGMDPGSVV